MSDGIHITDADAATLVYAAGLDPQLEARARLHAVECAECAAKLDRVRASDQSAAALLTLLDVAAPPKTAAGFVRTARVTGEISLGGPRRVAAGIVVLMFLAGAAAAAIPSSPLHRLIVSALGGKRTAHGVTGPASPVPQGPASSGVSITSPSALEVVFNSESAGALHIRISDGDQVALTSTDVAAIYRVGTSRITVSQATPADFHLDIPRRLRELRILAGDKLIFSRSPDAPMSTDTLTIRLSARTQGSPTTLH